MESNIDAQAEMVRGYQRGFSGHMPESDRVAYMHGYRIGKSDRDGIAFERADVLRRRADIIIGAKNG